MVVGMADEVVLTEPIKYTVMLRPEAYTAVVRTADVTHVSRTDTINRAVQIYAVLAEQLAAGKEILLADKDGSIERMRIIF